MAEMAELAYGGRVEHSAALTPEGRRFRDADMARRGTPGAEPFESPDLGFASRGMQQTTWEDPSPEELERRRAIDDAIRAGRTPGDGRRQFDDEDDEDGDVQRQRRRRQSTSTGRNQEDRYIQFGAAGVVANAFAGRDGFASRGNFRPLPTQNEDAMGDSSLDQLADKLKLDELENLPDDFDEIEQMAARIAGRIAGGEATLAEKLGITPEQLRVRYRELAKEINEFVDRFVQDKDVRKNVKLGYKILSHAAILFGAKGMKDFLSTVNPSAQGTGQGSDASSLLDIVDVVLSTGLHDALIAYGMNFANLIATEYAAMRLTTKQKAKEMIEEIRARIEGTGQKIGVMSTEMWNRLRGAWAKTRATAPIPATAGVKEWIIAGSSPMWAEMSWLDYQAKSRITQHLEPTNQAIWSTLAVKAGQSPELIDIAAYRAGIGYGKRRIKSKDVVRVYL